MTEYPGLRPIKKDGPARIRDTDCETVYGTYSNLRAQDPNRDKRTVILQAYCREPYEISHDDCLVEGYGTNYGELTFKVTSKIQTAVDFLTERPTAFTITTNYRDPKLDVESADFHSVRHSELITQAFHKFFIKRWDKWQYNIQMDAFSWNMFGKSFQYWSDPLSPCSEHIHTKDVYPDSEATMFMDDWDTCFIRMPLYAWELWDMAQKDRENRWNKENLIYLLKYSFKQDKWREDAIMKGFNNYQLDYTLQNRKLAVVVMLVREYKAEKGKKISKYIFSEEWPKTERSETDKNKGFLFRQPFAFESMSKTLCMLSDQVGTGYYYNNPSFAESIYVASYEYDRLMNKIMRGIDLSMMLFMKSKDANAGSKIRENILQDAIIMGPGTDAEQVTIRIPVGDAFQIMQKVQSDVARGTSSYEIGTPNPAGGSTPVTARQNQNDANRALQAESMYLKWLNQSYARYGQELYTRFVSDRTGETGDNLRDFEKWLKDRNVPEECWKAKNVEVVSTGMQGAGNPQQRFDQAVMVMDILARVPNSAGEQKAQRDAIAALVGADKVDEYMAFAKEFTTKEEQKIMMENATLSTLTELNVQPDDLHILHFQLHMQSAEQDLRVAAQRLQNPTNEIDKGIDLNEAATSLMRAQFKAAHSGLHLQFIMRDARQRGVVQQAEAAMAELTRQADQIEKIANQITQAREEKMAELNGTDPEIQKARELAQIQIDTARQLADIKLGGAIEKAEASTDLAKQKSNLLNELKLEDTATNIAIKKEEADQKLEAQRKKDVLDLSVKEEEAKLKLETIKQQNAAKRANSKKAG